MKLKQTIILYLLFFLISSNLINSTTVKTKRSHKNKLKLKRKSIKTHTNTNELAEIKNKFENIFDKLIYDRDLFDFSIGAIEGIYNIKDFDKIYMYRNNLVIFPKVKECFTKKIFFDAMLKETKIPIDEKWNSLETKNDRYDFCLKAKEDVITKYNKRMSWKKYLSSFIDDSDDKCTINDDKIDDRIKNRFYNECFYFKTNDCDRLKNEIYAYVSTFLEKSVVYSYSIENVVDCLRQGDYIWNDYKFDSFRAASKISVWKKIREEWYIFNSKNQLEEWGGIKGSYYIIELGRELKILNDDIFMDNGKYYHRRGNLYYFLGNLVGKALKIAHLVKTKEFK